MAQPHAQPDPHAWLAAHGDYLYRFALARLRDPYLAEEAVQDTLLAAMQGGGFAGKSSERTWLTGILKHKIIDQFRRQQREVALESPEEVSDEPGMDDFFAPGGHWLERPQEWGEPAQLLQQEQFLAVLAQCLARLPAKQAQLFVLREIEQCDNDEICKELDISATNAWVMLYRARMGLRKCMEMNWLGRGG